MAGIYIHIPFCKQACNYCDFHFSTSLKLKDDFLNALIKEIGLQKDYLGGEIINTIYFGGGTPSLLSGNELQLVFNSLHENFNVNPSAEITFEVNPDDLTSARLAELKSTPVNRLSIGIQSFRAEDLKWMNRAHDPVQAFEAVGNARNAGFTNISIDLIYGFNELTDEGWNGNIDKALSLRVEHISAYNLTVEPKTILDKDIRKGKSLPLDSAIGAKHFKILSERLNDAGYLHYEISNFAKPGYLSQHNTNYWRREKYLGLGPSAHSYNGISRQWNIKNNQLYITSINNEELPAEKEDLTAPTQYNEYILTTLRTMWGTDLDYIEKKCGSHLHEYCLKEAQRHVKNKNLEISNNKLLLTDEGKLFADAIASDLFFID